MRWPSRWRAAAPCASPPTTAISSGSTRSSGAITARTRAIVTISPNNPSGAVLREADAARAQRRSAGSAGFITSPMRPTSTSPTAMRATLAGLVPGCRRAHLVALLAVESVRVRRLAHRLRGVSRASGRGDDEEPGHDPRSARPIASQLAAVRGARGRPAGTASRTSASSPKSARSSSARLGGTGAPGAGTGGGRRVLLPAQGVRRRSTRSCWPSG